MHAFTAKPRPCHLCEPPPFDYDDPADLTPEQLDQIEAWEDRVASKLLDSKKARADKNTLYARWLFRKDEVFKTPPPINMTFIQDLNCTAKGETEVMYRGYLFLRSLTHHLEHFPNDEETYVLACQCLDMLNTEIRRLQVLHPRPPVIDNYEAELKRLVTHFDRRLREACDEEFDAKARAAIADGQHPDHTGYLRPFERALGKLDPFFLTEDGQVIMHVGVGYESPSELVNRYCRTKEEVYQAKADLFKNPSPENWQRVSGLFQAQEAAMQAIVDEVTK